MRGSRWPVAVSDDDLAPYLAGAPRESTDLFWRFIALARGCGPVTFELQGPSVIVLRGTRRIFSSVVIGRTSLQGHIVLSCPLRDDERIYKIAPLTKRLFGNWYKVTFARDLDEEFAGWLRAARDIGDGAHLARGAGKEDS
jgi:hypothetical protein